MIIDVDSHWEAKGYAPGGHPLEPWLERLPQSLELLRFAIAGDLLASLPRAEWPTPAELLPSIVGRAPDRGGRRCSTRCTSPRAATDQLSGHAGRPRAAAVVDFTDLGEAAKERERARRRPARRALTEGHA
jgi:hypothetical protein